MSATRRSIFAPAGADLMASMSTSALAETPGGSGVDETVAELIRRSAEANAGLMRGNTDRYRALNPHTNDYTLMSPFGGSPSHGTDLTDERWEAIGRFFHNGTFEQEVVQSYRSTDMVVLVIIERCHVEAGGLPAQEWTLRVTLVYCREGSDWRLAHRHADPLGKGVSLEQAAALSRGAR